MLNISNYLFNFDYLGQIHRYISDHSEKYHLKLPASVDGSNHVLVNYLDSQKKLLTLTKEKDKFHRFLQNLAKREIRSVMRINMLRLCFVLELSHQEADDFLLNYMHETELSARSLEEFIVICALRIPFGWAEVCGLYEKYSSMAEEPCAPRDLGQGMTNYVYAQNIKNIHTLDELQAYLEEPSAPECLSFFAKTRNTQYLALFDDVLINMTENRADLIDDRKTSDMLSIQNYYNRLFGLRSLDGDIGDNFLTRTEITKLTCLFKDVFLSVNTFSRLVKRERNEQIPAGTYLLHLLLTFESDDQNKTAGINFTDPTAFFTEINRALRDAGFPSLNPARAFDRLVKDVYMDTLAELNNTSGGQSSETTRKTFLFNLRAYLKQMADL